MPTIKTTAAGLIITKGGKPSCSCCGPCSPDVTTVYVEHVIDPLGSPEVTYVTLTGSLNAGTFIGAGPSGLLELIWGGISSGWYIQDGTIGTVPENTALTRRCNPQGLYDGSAYGMLEATVSFTPLP